MASGSTIGFKTDTMVAAGADGTMIALLKRLTTDISGMAGIGDSTSGTMGAVSDAVTLANVQGTSFFAVQISGTFVATVVFEATVDGTNWVGTTGEKMPVGGVQAEVGSATAAGWWVMNAPGATSVRVRCSAYTSGSVLASLRAVANAHNASTVAGSSATSISTIIGAALQGVDTNGHNAFYGLVTCALPWLLNASNQFERQRTAVNANGTALGVSAVHNLFFDGTNYGWVNGGVLSADARLASDTGMNQRAYGYAFNGTTWDRVRSPGLGTVATGKFRTTVASVPVVGTGTAYTTGDAIGPVTTASGVFRLANGGALLKGLSISCKSGNADIALGIRIYFFNANPSGSTLTDNAAISVVDADIGKIITYVDIATAISPGTGTANEVWVANNLDLQLVANSGGTGLHYCLEARGAIAANAGVSDWTVNLHLEQD